jgi:hypothetical protein
MRWRLKPPKVLIIWRIQSPVISFFMSVSNLLSTLSSDCLNLSSTEKQFLNICNVIRRSKFFFNGSSPRPLEPGQSFWNDGNKLTARACLLQRSYVSMNISATLLSVLSLSVTPSVNGRSWQGGTKRRNAIFTKMTNKMQLCRINLMFMGPCIVIIF